MDREARLDQVVGLLYDAALEPERWPAALTAIADLLGAVGSQYYFWSRQENATRFAAVGRLPEEGNAAYLRYYGAIDTRRQALERVPVGEVIAYDLDFDDGRFRKSEFFNDFLAPYGVPYVAGGRPFETADLSAVMAVLRSFRQGPFGPAELALLARLLPHLQRAARLQLQLAEATLQGRAAEVALDRLPFGIVIADATGRALDLNRAAEDMLAAGDGLMLCHGRLTADYPDEAATLIGHIREAVLTARRCYGEGGGSLSITRPSGRRPYALLIAPLGADAALAAEHQAPTALILIADLERQPPVLGRRLIDLFGLTPAEACLAVALAAGQRLEDVARERGVRMPTLRTQLHAILDKTGTRRQAELIGLIARLPAVRG